MQSAQQLPNRNSPKSRGFAIPKEAAFFFLRHKKQNKKGKTTKRNKDKMNKRRENNKPFREDISEFPLIELAVAIFVKHGQNHGEVLVCQGDARYSLER